MGEGQSDFATQTHPPMTPNSPHLLRRLAVLLVLATSVLASAPADAQGLLGRARRAAQRGAERAVEREADRRADEAVTGAIDGALGSDPAAASGASPAPGPDGAGPAAPLVNYDFVPGDRILFADDLTGEHVGDFPRRLRLLRGNGEAAEWQGRRFLRMTSFGGFAIELPHDLPERFTLEFEAAVSQGWTQELSFSDGTRNVVRFSAQNGGVGGDVSVNTPLSPALSEDTVFPVKLMVDGGYVKVYLNGVRVANVPDLALGRSRRVTFTVSGSADSPAYFGGFRLAEGGRDLPAFEVTVAGVVAEPPTPEAPPEPLVLHGVEFDTGRATLRPESGPVLDAVARSLAAHPDARVRVEGHTDATGSAETNRQLSLSRAEAVAAALAARGVAADRMEAAGFGPDRPVADNATPEGRQQNRRVALVRI